jgi:beta-phosphoglucomutase-like phosphatase (HAD superfamily)
VDLGIELQKTNLKAVEGAPELVSAVAGRYKSCVASNGERSSVLSSLTITGLIEHFKDASIFTKNQVQNPKPYPDLFLFAASQMGEPAERCLVIEDSVTGVRAGVAAGMTVWGFTGTHHAPEKHAETLKEAGANAVFESLIHMRARLVI